jgi:TonB family protein
MKSIRKAIILAISALPLLHADVTIHFKMEMKSLVPVAMPADTHEIRMKGNKGVSSDGNQITIMDFAKQEITLIDKAHRKFAVIPASEYGSKMAAIMPQMAVGDSSAGPTKSKVESGNTGHTETILGVATEESETSISTEMPLSAVLQGQSLTMKIVTRQWNALPAETARVPAIRQLMGFNLWQDYFMGDTETIKKMFPQGGAAIADGFKTGSTTLRSSTKMYMNMPGTDAGAPFMEMNYEITELSTAPVDDVFFEIPTGYDATTFGELMNGLRQERLQAAMEQKNQLAKPIAGDVQVYVSDLMPLTQTQPELPEEARRTGTQGMVQLLLTVGADGHVAKAEALSGPEALRKDAVEAVKDWTYRPVLRNGVAVPAFTDATVSYFDWSKGPGAATPSMQDMMGPIERRAELERSLPRTPQQKLVDLEQDSLGGDKLRRFYALTKMTDAALKMGDDRKAGAYARELLSASADFPKDWNYGNAIHDGHMTLGLLAVRRNDIETARHELLEAGKTPGSPQLDSFGPNMALAKELLEKGERQAVVEYLASCGTFWKLGQENLRAWAETINQGGMPVFGVTLR